MKITVTQLKELIKEELKEIVDKKDMTSAKCPCGGTYKEASLHDDREGKLTCSDCSKQIRRWQSKPKQ